MNLTSGKGTRLWIHQDSPEKKDYPLLGTNFNEEFGHFSPEGRWLAYVSEETGKDEIFVVPFPSLSSKTSTVRSRARARRARGRAWG